MKRVSTAGLPPIEVEERPEKLTLAVPPELKIAMEQFGQFFADTSGHTPTSFNAVIVGILTGYLETHKGYQRWLKNRNRSNDSLASSAASA